MTEIISWLAFGFTLYLLTRVSSLKSSVQSLREQIRSLEKKIEELREPESIQDKPEPADDEPSEPVEPTEEETDEDDSPEEQTPRPQSFQDRETPEDTVADEGEREGQRPPSPVSTSKSTAGSSKQSTTLTPDNTSDLIDWENFTGKKLFAWLGGFALFLGMVFLLRFAYQEGWINPPPSVKVAGGFLLGIGLILAALKIQDDRYEVTIHTFAASGCAILYADVFAAFRYYNLLPSSVTFFLMILITVTALLLSDRLPSLYVALLGLLGGFLTPPLLATGQDAPISLFVYIAFLNVGLVTVAIRQNWDFLLALGAIATFVTEIGWFSSQFHPSKAITASAIFIGFSYFYCGVFELTKRYTDHKDSDLILYTALSVSLLSLGLLPAYMQYHHLATSPGLFMTVLLLLNLGPVGLAISDQRARNWHLATGLVTFLILLAWTQSFLPETSIYWSLPYYLAFGVLHGGTPVVLQRYEPVRNNYLWGHLYPSFIIFLVLFPVMSGTIVSLVVWPFVLVLTLINFGLAIMMSSGLAIVLNLALIFTGIGFWIPNINNLTIELTGIIMIVLFFSLLFFTASLLFTRFDTFSGDDQTSFFGMNPEVLAQTLPSLSALSPFALVIVMIESLPTVSPSPIFGLSLLMIVLLLGLVRYQKMGELSLVSLLAISVVIAVWHRSGLTYGLNTIETLTWYGVFYALFFLFPLVQVKRVKQMALPWVSSSFAGPAVFYFVYDIVANRWGATYIGGLPACFALITVLSLTYLVQVVPESNTNRRTILALYGGIALFFITLIFPLQLSREWLTISWALEGVALLWLYQRIQHQGLPIWGCGLLLIAFGRLALNPAVFDYYLTTSNSIFNWFLYTYGIVSACLFAAEYWLRDVDNHQLRRFGRSIAPALGTILLFYLLNIEIANYFTPIGRELTFNFSASLAQDVTYSLGWASFGFVLLVVGFYRQQRYARIGSLGLISVTILKVFFHDLWQLGQLYRVASLFGLSIVLILVSVIYQMFVSEEAQTVEG